MEPVEPVSPSKKKVVFKIFGFILVMTVVAALSSFATYQYLNNQNLKASTDEGKGLISLTSLPTDTPQVEDSGIPIKENTISFARYYDAVVLRYKNSFYGDTKKGVAQMEGIDEKKYTWTGLVDDPYYASDGFHDILSLRAFSDKKRFIYTTRWTNDSDKNKHTWDLNIFYYNPYKKTGKNIKLATFSGQDAKEFTIPFLGILSPDEKFVSVDMYYCWNCEPGIPQTLLLNLESGKTKRIGRTSLFKWGSNGKYEFKEYKQIACVPEGMEICPVDESPPVQQGQFD